jgi:hypothetical protein
MKSLLNVVLDGLKDPIKQMKAHKMKFKEPQSRTRLCLKPTPRSKRNKTKENHRKGTLAQKKNSLASLGKEASRRMGTLDIPREAA